VSDGNQQKTIVERTAIALKRRLRPHTNLSAYELAVALQLSEPTIWNLLSGNSKSGPSGRVLHKLVEFFGASFLQEVFGGPGIHVIDPRATQKAARIAELHEELRRLA
jgi:transcriptional regulator with XRE-family HTH domain